MKHYVLAIYQPDGIPGPEIDLETIMRDVRAVGDEMRAAGAWVFAAGMEPADPGTVVRGELVTDGPYLEGKEHVGGFTIIQVADLDEALKWARKLSDATTLPIEVRATHV
jgi:hypothetical protein